VVSLSESNAPPAGAQHPEFRTPYEIADNLAKREASPVASESAESTRAEHIAFSGKVEPIVAPAGSSQPEQARATERPESIDPPRPVRLPPEAPEALRTPLRALTVSVEPQGGTERTDIHLVHRNGIFDMAVRATNPETARILRNELPELVRSLEQQGFHSDLEPGEQNRDGRSRRQYERTDDDD
jgi:hypothetical protein